MRVKHAIAAAVLGSTMTITGAGVASAAPTQNAGAVAGLVAAAVNVNDAVDINSIRIVTVEDEVLSNINVDIRNVRVLSGFVIRALNNNDIDVDVSDVVDVNVVGNVLVVVVDVA